MAALDGSAMARRSARHMPAELSATNEPRVDGLGRRPGVPRRRTAGIDACRGPRARTRSQPTIRAPIGRLRGLDRRGQVLFERLPEGLRLSAAGERLVPVAESVEDAVLTLERRRAAASPVLSGTVRVSTGECAAGFLARCLSGPTTTALPSGITLELVDARQGANLARREASTRRSVTSRRTAATSTLPRPAPSPSRSTGGKAQMPAPGSPIPRSKRIMSRHGMCSGRSRRRACRWRCAPRRC